MKKTAFTAGAVTVLTQGLSLGSEGTATATGSATKNVVTKIVYTFVPGSGTATIPTQGGSEWPSNNNECLGEAVQEAIDDLINGRPARPSEGEWDPGAPAIPPQLTLAGVTPPTTNPVATESAVPINARITGFSTSGQDANGDPIPQSVNAAYTGGHYTEPNEDGEIDVPGCDYRDYDVTIKKEVVTLTLT